MQAFLNDLKVKEFYLKRVKDHQEADEIIRGTYWLNGKGCAVGCCVHSSNHKAYETELGIPEWLAYVEDSLFEGMNIEKSKEWPFRFLNAIKIGIDLNKIKASFQIMVLNHVLKNLEKLNFIDENFPKESKLVVKEVIDIWKKYPQEAASAAIAAIAAWAASAASAAIAAIAAWAASAAIADSVAIASWAASVAIAASAASAAIAAIAAWAASAASADSVSSASWAASAAIAASAERIKTFDYFADELIKMIEECK